MVKLLFRYDEAGGVEIEGKGFKGNACEKATAAFIQGRNVKLEKKTPEFYQQTNAGVKTSY